MVGASLPEPAAEAFDEADSLVLVRKIHLPDQRTVAEDPHGGGGTGFWQIKEAE